VDRGGGGSSPGQGRAEVRGGAGVSGAGRGGWGRCGSRPAAALCRPACPSDATVASPRSIAAGSRRKAVVRAGWGSVGELSSSSQSLRLRAAPRCRQRQDNGVRGEVDAADQRHITQASAWAAQETSNACW